MSKNVNQIIEAAIQKPTTEAVKDAVNQLLGESVKVGDEVGVIDDDSSIGGYIGKGRVKSLGENPDGGFVDVELANGTVIKAQSSLLLKV